MSDTAAVRDVLAERERQRMVEGFLAPHDDEHRFGEMAEAAACYALCAPSPSATRTAIVDRLWPWSRAWWKPRTYRRNLVKAAALLLAEIERLDRTPTGEST